MFVMGNQSAPCTNIEFKTILYHRKMPLNFTFKVIPKAATEIITMGETSHVGD
jgi:hypothetical protein